MLKDIEQQKLRKGLNNKERIFVKHFSGATVEDMENYVIPSKKYENDLVILHVGTNDLRDQKAATEIAEEIAEVAIDMKTEKKRYYDFWNYTEGQFKRKGDGSKQIITKYMWFV